MQADGRKDKGHCHWLVRIMLVYEGSTLSHMTVCWIHKLFCHGTNHSDAKMESCVQGLDLAVVGHVAFNPDELFLNRLNTNSLF